MIIVIIIVVGVVVVDNVVLASAAWVGVRVIRGRGYACHGSKSKLDIQLVKKKIGNRRKKVSRRSRGGCSTEVDFLGIFADFLRGEGWAVD